MKKQGFLIDVQVNDCGGDKGKGVFTLVNCHEGQLLWEPVLVTTRTPTEAQAYLDSLKRDEAQELLRQSFVSGDDMLCSNPQDDGRFMNHSSTPNCLAGLKGGRATRPIVAGEELTCDYGLLPCPKWYENLCIDFGVHSTGYIAKHYNN